MDQKAIIAIVIAAVVVVGGGVGIAIALSNGGDSEASYTVKFNVNGGDAIDDKSFTKNTETFSLPDATREGYAFLGWYGNADFTGDKITQVEKGTEKDIEVWAKWQLVLANNTAPTAAQVTANTDVKVTFDSGLNKEDEKRTITPEVRDALTSGKTLTIEDTQQNLTWTFTGSDSKQTGYADETFDTAVVATPDIENKKVVLAFDYEGTLPYQSTVRYLFGVNYAGQQVTAENSRTHEIIGPCTVDAQGYVEFPIDHCSDWVLAVSYNVTFDAAGGTIDGAATKTVTVQYKDAVGALPTAKRTGYTFAAWTPAVTAETAVTDNVTYTATWTENQYTINFDKNSNDATGTMESITIGYTETKNIPSCTFTNTGYSASWNTLANDSGTPIAAGGSITGQLASEAAGVESLVVTLFAQWTANTYIATFDANGGTIADADATRSIVYKTAYGTLPAVNRTGFTLTGWNTAANGGGTAVTAESIYDVADDMTVYAQWDIATYTITYVMGDGATNNPGNPTSYNIRQDLTFLGATKDGSAFMGWFKDANYATGQVTSVAAGTMTGDLTLYAKWGNNNITASFTLDGAPMEVTGTVTANGESASATMTKLSTGTYQIETSDALSIVNGNTYTIKVGNDAVGSVVIENGSGTVYIYYYTVTFKNGTETVAVRTVLKNGTVGEIDAPEKTGYTLSAWLGNEGSIWTPSLQITHTLVVSASWTPRTYTVTFDRGEGAGGPDSVTATYDANIPNLAALPERDGFDFLGYYLGDVMYINDQGAGVKAWDRTQDTQLVARWDVKKYSAVIDLNAGTVNSSDVGIGWTYADGKYSKKFEFGTQISAILTDFAATPSREHYTFNAWDPNTGTIGTAGVQLTATYAAKNYTVVFNTNGGSGTVASIQNVHDGSVIEQPEYTGTLAGHNNTGSWAYYDIGQPVVPFTDGSLTVTSYVLAYADEEHSTLTFYAAWEPKTYTVAFNANGGTGDLPASQTNKKFGDSVTLVAPTVTKEGKYFGGWNTKADGTGANYRGSATVDNSFIEFADGTTVTLYIKWTDGIYTATVGDVFSGTNYQYNQSGDQIYSAPWKAVVIWANASYYKAEMLFSTGNDVWESDGFATVRQGNYPLLYMDQREGFAEMMRGNTPNTNYLQISRNGVTSLVTVTVYEGAELGVGYMIAEDSDGTCYQYRYSYGGGGSEYFDIMMELDTIREGEGNGYTPTAYSVSYRSAKNSETPIVSSDSLYKSPEQLSMQIPDGMYFVGWRLGDKNFYEGDEDELYQPGYVVTCPHSVYAIWAEIIIDPTNIDWKVVNLPEGITMTIDGEDAYESNGVQNHYVVFTGGDDWSKEQIEEGQYLYTFRLGETVYHAQIHKYKDAKITDAPDGNRMRIQFGANDSGQYTITIYFWMDMPCMNGYLAAVNDVFVYHQDVLGYGSDITCTVTEVGAHGTYDATVGDRSWDFRDYMYPFDSSGAIPYLNFDEPGNTTQYAGVYVYTVENRDVLGGSKQCYVIKESIYSRTLHDERVELNEFVQCEGLYGVDDGLLYLYTGPNSTTTLTSKPAEMGIVSQYQAILNGNGGTFGGEPTRTIDYAFEFDGSSPSLADRVLQKWNTRADGTGRDYVDGDRFNPADAVDGTVTLYAQGILDGFYLSVTAEGATPSSLLIEKPYRTLNLGTLDLYPYDIEGYVPPTGKAASAIMFGEDTFNSVTVKSPAYGMTDLGNGTYRYGGGGEGFLKVQNKEVYYKSEYGFITIYAYDGETVDLSLVWTTEVTTVTYHSNFGPDATVTVNYINTGLIDGRFLAADTFTRDGYTFIGWGRTSDAEPNNTAIAGDYYMSSMGTEFWAIWDMSMTVTYNANGGSGTIADQNILLSSRNYLSSGNGLSRDGYVLVGWTLSSNSNVLIYGKEAEFTMEESNAGTTLELYALWATGTYTVHFTRCDRGQGEFEGEMADQVIGVGIQTKLNAVTYEDITDFYEFAYWVLTEDGGGTRYTDKTYVTNLEGAGAGDTVTLKAWWEPVKYIVHYVLNPPYGSECDGEMADQIIDVGEPTALSNCGFNGDENYAFSGWNTEYNGTGTSYTNGQIVTDLIDGGATFTLYAQWRSTKYTVNFDENLLSVRPLPEGISITGEMDSQIIRVGETVELSACGFAATNTYFTFTGWNTDRNGSGDRYDDGAEVEDLAQGGATITLFAQWVRTSYTLVFDPGENPDEEHEWEDTGFMENQSRLVGDGLAISACTYTPLEGVVFDHWLVDYGDDVTEEFPAGYTGDITRENGSAPKVTAIWRLSDPEE